jgi:alkylation response protein AidB-like acyl-CoA dehydrogenase
MWRCETDIEHMIRDSAEGFVADRHSMARTRACAASPKGFEPAIWKEMAELGWTGLLLPEADGGSALPIETALILSEVFGRHAVPEPLVASAVIAGTILAGSEREAARSAAQALAAGQAVVTLAYREAETWTADVRPATRVAAMSDGTLFLTGKKALVPFWHEGVTLLVTAWHEAELAIIVLRADTLGIAAEPRRMTDGSFAADICFEDVNVGREQIIATGPAAEALLRQAIAHGLLAASALLEGLAQAMLRMTIDYVDQRIQFDRPLGANQALRHALVDLNAQVELAGAAWRTAAARLLEVGGVVAAEGAISAAKARCAETALAVARSAIQYHGAFGYTEEADVGLFVNMTLRLATWLGNAAQHRDYALELHERKNAKHD